MSLVPAGVIHGRFQPLHLGHMEYILAGKNRCQQLVIGIANPDPNVTIRHQANPARSLPSSNPFTYYERMLMIKNSLLEAGVSRHDFEIVPFPINYPQILKYYVPMDARFFVTIYDDWGKAKVNMLTKLGLDIEVMWERNLAQRLTTGTEIRKLIAKGDAWEHLLPFGAVKIINELGLKERVKSLLNS